MTKRVVIVGGGFAGLYCARALRRACDEFEADPMAYVGLPDWNRITAAIPDFLERYRDAVDAEID